jgi:hypothetical protein
MTSKTWRGFAVSLALTLAACSSEKPNSDEELTKQDASPAPTASASAAPARVSQYTSLANCKLIEESSEGEGDYSLHACPGLAGYGLKLSEDDLRQDLWVQLPGGGEESLALSEVTKSGGFSRIGDNVEWRGKEEGGQFRPDALIVRYFVVENPDTPEKETSYLLAVSLAGAKPCVTGKLQPGPDQNERARQAADREMTCLPAP